MISDSTNLQAEMESVFTDTTAHTYLFEIVNGEYGDSTSGSIVADTSTSKYHYIDQWAIIDYYYDGTTTVKIQKVVPPHVTVGGTTSSGFTIVSDTTSWNIFKTDAAEASRESWATMSDKIWKALDETGTYGLKDTIVKLNATRDLLVINRQKAQDAADVYEANI